MKMTRSFRLGLCALCALLIGAALLTVLVLNARTAPTLTARRTGAPAWQRSTERPAPDMSLPGQVGWLTVPGTDIDGPVMQAEDNDYYLRRNEAGQDDVWGCYFMDYECGTESQNRIVYGHSLDDSPDEARFSQLKRFLDESFYKKNKTIELYYNGEWNVYEVFSAGYADADQDRLAILADPAPDVAALLIETAQKRSEIKADTAVTAADKLLTLCTCTADAQTRFVVTGVLK